MKSFVQRLIAVNLWNLRKIIINNKIQRGSVVHVGANFGQEADVYDECGFQTVIWVEGYKEYAERLRRHVEHRKNHYVIESMVSDVSGEEVDFSIASNTGSSTIFQVTAAWRDAFADISILNSVRVRCERLDRLLPESLIKNRIDLLVLDIEGAELKALKSLGTILPKVESALIEVSLIRNFQGGPLFIDIELYMLSNNFVRVYSKYGVVSGDILYKKVPQVSDFRKCLLKASCRIIMCAARLKLTKVFWKLKQNIKQLVRLNG